MDAQVPAAATRYDLVITGGETALRWRFDDHGVTLSHDGLAWAVGGAALERKYADIFAIRLQRNSAGKGPGIGNCRIAFRDGSVLTVLGGNDKGLADDALAPLFAAFVHDLHKRLAQRDDT